MFKGIHILIFGSLEVQTKGRYPGTLLFSKFLEHLVFIFSATKTRAV